jgi:hypothetical protein
MTTPRQMAFIQDLLATRVISDDVRSWAEDRMYDDPSGVIGSLLTCPKPAKNVRQIDDGIYYVNGMIYKVQHSQTTGRPYAKRLDPREGWLYDPSYLSEIPDGAKPPTFEEMFAFGFTYDVCGNCGKLLTDPESVHAKIGPVCAKKLYGLTPKQLRLRADAEYARRQQENLEHAGIWRRNDDGTLTNLLQDA